MKSIYLHQKKIEDDFQITKTKTGEKIKVDILNPSTRDTIFTFDQDAKLRTASLNLNKPIKV